MHDLIERQAVIDAFYKHPNIYWTTLDVLAKIDALPSAQPKTGMWLPDNNYIHEQYVCSECKNSFKVDTCMGKPMWNFCPNCGCRMLKEGD